MTKPKPTIQDLKVIKTYLEHALENIEDPLHGDLIEAVDYINDALAQIKKYE